MKKKVDNTYTIHIGTFLKKLNKFDINLGMHYPYK